MPAAFACLARSQLVDAVVQADAAVRQDVELAAGNVQAIVDVHTDLLCLDQRILMAASTEVTQSAVEVLQYTSVTAA